MTERSEVPFDLIRSFQAPVLTLMSIGSRLPSASVVLVTLEPGVASAMLAIPAVSPARSTDGSTNVNRILR